MNNNSHFRGKLQNEDENSSSARASQSVTLNTGPKSPLRDTLFEPWRPSLSKGLKEILQLDTDAPGGMIRFQTGIGTLCDEFLLFRLLDHPRFAISSSGSEPLQQS